MIYVLDTNIVSYYLKGLNNIDNKIDETLSAENSIVISQVTMYETLRGLFAVGAINKLRIFDELRTRLGIFELQTEDWTEAAHLYANNRRHGILMSETDLIQAALCLRHNFALVTHNTKHFEHIAGLLLEDWVQAS